MNLQIFMTVTAFTKLSSIFFAMLVGFTAFADGWKLDLSRRTNEIRKQEYIQPENAKQDKGMLDFLFSGGEPIQEVVVLNTDKGFVPSTLRVREGLRYKLHVVNVNDKEKNVSFVLDAFSEHHATYYGQIKSLHLKPQKEGVYTFLCPETSAKGRLVVYPAHSGVRLPASE